MRLTWDEFFMKQAVEFSSMATCARLKVGCIISKGNLQLAEGYNGSLSGHDHCVDVGCLLNEQGRCIRCIHAEQNAIINAMDKGLAISGCTAYVTHECCENCTKILHRSKIKRIVYLKEYKNKYNEHFSQGIEVEVFKGSNREELLETLEKYRNSN
jgi:dCMP deaminase